MSTAAVRKHWTRVAALGCLICGSPAQIAHCHGPSLCERDPRFLKPKGKKLPWQDWLVIPLAPLLHVEMDCDPAYFAARYGTPAQLLDIVCAQLDVDVWAQARALLRPTPKASP